MAVALPACGHENQELISPQLLLDMGVAPARLYDSGEIITAIALRAKETGGQGFAALPFCHTTEAAALGADITPADETAGPRPGQYTCKSLADIPLRPLAQDPVIGRLLTACRQLSQAGERVVYQVTGPISLLSCLMDLSVLFKTWRKDPAAVDALWQGLIPVLLDYVGEICAAGASLISYADPAGNGDILGPKYTRLLTQGFTLPFLRQAAARCGRDATLVLCPLTAAALTQAEVLRPARPGEEGQAACGCIKSGRGSFARRMCLAP